MSNIITIVISDDEIKSAVKDIAKELKLEYKACTTTYNRQLKDFTILQFSIHYHILNNLI